MGRRRVLIVDDERLLREAMCDLLSDTCDVEAVGSVAAAQRRLADGGSDFDVVLCDVQLPDGTAGDVRQALRGATRLVMVTGGGEPLARRLGGDAPVLHKPFDLDELPALLDALLR
jgi:DNA-binding response OmpR family regulator